MPSTLPHARRSSFWAKRGLPLFVFCAIVGGGLSARADNWPQWRGPDGDGVSRETDLPIVWNESLHVRWEIPLPEWGNSTPAIWKESIFLTAQVNNDKLLLLKIDKATGHVLWTRQVGAGACPQRPVRGKSDDERRRQFFEQSHNFASPSPVTDGRRVVVHFGNGDLAAYDFAGNRLWYRNLQKDYGDYTIWWGHANSPVLCGDLVISICIQDSCADLPGKPSPSYVVAHDVRNGHERWKMMRMTSATRESCDSYVTPILWHNGDRLELVVLGGRMLDAYDPATGKVYWQLPGLIGNRTITGAVAGDGMIFATQGIEADAGGLPARRRPPHARRRGLAIFSGRARLLHAGGVGAVGLLRQQRGHRPLPRRQDRQGAMEGAAEGGISGVAGGGRRTCLLPQYQGPHHRDGRLPRLRRLAENQLDADTLASPAISDGRIYIRGRKALYCIGR